VGLLGRILIIVDVLDPALFLRAIDTNEGLPMEVIDVFLANERWGRSLSSNSLTGLLSAVPSVAPNGKIPWPNDVPESDIWGVSGVDILGEDVSVAEDSVGMAFELVNDDDWSESNASLELVAVGILVTGGTTE
jgi:hypothetical protein